MPGVLRFFTVMAFVFALFAPQIAQAQAVLQQFEKPLKELELMPQDEFEAQTTLFEAKPYGQKTLAYKVRLPSDWEKSEDSMATSANFSTKLLSTVGLYYSKPRMVYNRSRFSIEVIELEYQLTAEQWFMQFIIANGHVVRGMKAHSPQRVESLYVEVQDGTSYVVRSLTLTNGNRILLVRYFMPMEMWEEEKVMQAQTIQSFKLVSPVKAFAEKMLKHDILDIATLKYPESWELKAPPVRSIERINVQLLHVGSDFGNPYAKSKALNGRIEVGLVSSYVADSIEEEMQRFKEEIQKKGLILGEIIETHNDFKFNKEFKASKVDVYECTDMTNTLVDYELWIEVLSYGDYYYFVSLLTPSRNGDLSLWLRNTQTFRVISSLISPQVDSVTVK